MPAPEVKHAAMPSEKTLAKHPPSGFYTRRMSTPRDTTAPPPVWKRTWFVAVLAGLTALIWRIPFILRYDLNFQTEYGECYLMAKNILKGDRPIYFWESSYAGTLPQFIAAGFFAIFGPSIELSTLVTVLAYAAAVALSVVYVRRFFGAGQALFAGAFACVGVPYLLHYCAEPAGGQYGFGMLMTAVFLALAVTVNRRGWTIGLAFAAGLLTGHCWYFNKQCAISIATIGLVFLLLPAGRARLKEFVSPRLIGVFVAAFLLGYWPELYFRFTQPPIANPPKLLGLASPEEMLQNVYWLGRVFPAYFDGDPLSRLPEGVHYLRYNPRLDSLPQTAVDLLGIGIAWVLFLLLLRRGWRAWQDRNLPVLLIAVHPLVNMFLIVVSKVAVGEYYAPKRYLFNSGLLLLLWLGIEVWEAWQARRKPLALFLALLLPLSAVHQYQMLQLPDELKDYREVVRQIRSQGYHSGVTWYTYAFSLIALSDEDIAFSCLDYNDHAAYRRQVEGQDTLVLVHPANLPKLPAQVQFFGKIYRVEGPPNLVGELGWTLFRRSS